MRPPNGPRGFPTVSASQMRTYGAGGFLLDSHEAEKGCPRLYKAKYVERRVFETERSYALAYGSFVHDALYLMEAEGLTPDEALEKAFPVDGDPKMFAEARADIDAYLERGASPTDRFATLAVEDELDGLLFVDEEFGEIWFRGFLDWLGVDTEVENVLHFVDYKTNRNPPSVEDVMGDVQMKGYAWLVRQNLAKFQMPPHAQVIGHLDAVKWREVEVRFTDEEIADWHSWAVAVVRAILRDDKGEPVINPGCGFCPIRYDCPAYAALPGIAADMAKADRKVMTAEEKVRWRDAANKVRLLLEKGVTAVDEEMKTAALHAGGLTVGDAVYVPETEWKVVIDMRALHRVLGSPFYDLVKTSKTAIENATKTWEPHRVAEVRQTITSIPTGTKIVRKKAE